MTNEIIKKIIKCLEMSKSQVNENEAANGLRLAKSLAEKHGLDLAEIVAQHEVNDDVIKHSVKAKKSYSTYEVILFDICDVLFETQHYEQVFNVKGYRQATMIFIGTSVSIKKSSSVYVLLKKMVERNARKLYGKSWSKDHRSYCEGFGYRLLDRAIEEVDDYIDSDTRAVSKARMDLVVQKVEEEQVKKVWKDLKFKKESSKKKVTTVNSTAFVRGHIAAEVVSLDFEKTLKEGNDEEVTIEG